MTDGERRRLVFHNLLAGHPVPTVMDALHLSEKQVNDDYEFVIQKIRSYRFERAMPVLPLRDRTDAINARLQLLGMLHKLNLNSAPKFSRIGEVPFTVNHGGGMSEAEQLMLEMRMRAATR